LPETVIHIGYPKAASTWLKHNLFPLSTRFKLADEEDVVDHIIRPNALTFDPDQHKMYFDSKYGDNILLSESMLSGSLIMTGNNGVYTKEICTRLKAIFPDAQIIIFIRNQIDIIVSSYLEYIKKGGSYNDLIIDLYKKAFGENAVHVFCYEQFASDPTGFVTAFIERFSLGIDLEKTDLTIKNNAYRQNLYPIVRFLNQFTRKGVFLKRYIIDLPYPRNFFNRIFSRLNALKMFGDKPDARKVLGTKNLSLITEHYKTSNKKLVEILKPINLEELGYPI